MSPPSYPRDAACKDSPDPIEFFPVSNIGRGGIVNWAYEHVAPVVDEWCQGCPVQEECYQEALGHPNSFGIWGGRYLFGGQGKEKVLDVRQRPIPDPEPRPRPARYQTVNPRARRTA